MKSTPLLAAILLASAAATHAAAPAARDLEYRHGDAVLQGYLALPADLSQPRPGVLVIHEWNGLGEYAQTRARQLAALGYVAFAVDMYGKGVYAETHEAAAKLAGMYRQDRQLMRGRIQAALEVLRAQPGVDGERIAALGYCFGGTTALELARSGADVRGVASFHGALSTPHPADAKHSKARILVLNGADDPHVSAAEITGFMAEMRAAAADWQLIQYGGAVHSFTVPSAGDDPAKGAAYHPAADRRSWAALRAFLEECFQ